MNELAINQNLPQEEFSMNLPIVQPNAHLIQAVNARELHAYLESKQQFADWIKSRIEKYDFVENVDYVVFQNFMKNPNGGRSSIEYAISVEMAKELSMVENNDKGKEARKYFIQCEKQVKQQIPQTYAQALRAYADEVEQKQALQLENQAMKPKAESWERFIDADGLLPSGAIGKLLGFNSAQEFNKAINEKRVAFKANDGSWQFYADFKDKEIGKMVAWERGEYNKAGLQLKWRTRAVEYFSKLFSRNIQEVTA